MKKRDRLIKLCEDLAEELLCKPIYIADTSDFYALVAQDEDEVGEIGIRVAETSQSTIQEHLEFERLTYKDTDYGLDYFTYSFLHEIGHHMTLDWFQIGTAAESTQALRSSPDATLAAYKSLPHEVAADLWSLKVCIPQNLERIKKFDKKVRKLLTEIRGEENGWK